MSTFLVGSIMVDLGQAIPLITGIIAILGTLWHLSSMYHITAQRINLLQEQLNTHVKSNVDTFTDLKDDIKNDFLQTKSAILHNREATERNTGREIQSINQRIEDHEMRIRELERRENASRNHI